MLHGHITLGNRDEAHETSLGREEVVSRGVETSFVNAVTDSEQHPSRIQKKSELHRGDHFPRGRGNLGEPIEQCCSRCRRALDVADERIDHAKRGRRCGAVGFHRQSERCEVAHRVPAAAG